MSTPLRTDSTPIAPAIQMATYQSNSPCVSCLSKVYCLHKSIDIQKLINPANHYVQKFKVKKGDPVFHNGDDHKHLYNIRNGHVKIEHSQPNGQHHITQFGMAGDLLGLDGWANGKHRYDAYALSDGELCSINIKQLQTAMKLDPSVTMIIEQLMSYALNCSQDHIFSLSTHSAEQKLAYFLIDYRNRLDHLNLRSTTIKLPMSREELRSYLGMTLETLSRTFTFLEHKGYITVKNKEISFVDLDQLEALLESRD
jgi:CRP/FNR family transcriptional regulator, anaerobic regulatory protein